MQAILRHPRRALLGIVLTYILAVCALPLLAQDAEGEVIYDTAYITSVGVVTGQEPIMINIEGELADPCTSIHDITQTVDERTITITVETERPADLMCAMVLEPFMTSVELATENLSGGTYTLVVGDIERTISVPEQTSPATPAVTCPDAGAGQARYDDDILCFLYPEDYLLVDNDDFILLDAGARADDGARATILILLAFEEETTLESIVVDLTAAQGSIPTQLTTIGGYPALVSDAIPAERGSRRAFIIVDGVLYGIDAQPNDPDAFPTSTAAMQAVWELITESLVFKP